AARPVPRAEATEHVSCETRGAEAPDRSRAAPAAVELDGGPARRATCDRANDHVVVVESFRCALFVKLHRTERFSTRVWTTRNVCRSVLSPHQALRDI